MPETPIQPKSPSKKGASWLKTILIVEIIVIVVGMFAGAYMYFVNNKSDKAETHTDSPKEETTEKPNDETANWKTYKNTKVRFQFSYPPRFSNPKLTKPSNNPEVTGVEDNVTGILIGDNSEQGFLLGIVPRNPNTTLDDLFNASLVLLPEENKKFFEKEQRIINGLETLKVKLNDRIVSAFFLTSTHSITLSMPLNPTAATEDEVETIISSFKPLD